jgi:hypothetical protein
MTPTNLKELLLTLPILTLENCDATHDDSERTLAFDCGDRTLVVTGRLAKPPTTEEICAFAFLYANGESDPMNKGPIVLSIDPGSNEWFAFFTEDAREAVARDEAGETSELEALLLMSWMQLVADHRGVDIVGRGSCARPNIDPSKREFFSAVN